MEIRRYRKFETNKFEIINLYIQYYTWNVLINFNKHDTLYNYLNNIFDYDLYKFQLNYTDYFDIKNVNQNITNMCHNSIIHCCNRKATDNFLN